MYAMQHTKTFFYSQHCSNIDLVAQIIPLNCHMRLSHKDKTVHTQISKLCKTYIMCKKLFEEMKDKIIIT